MKNKQTKIIATISDTNCSTSFIKELYDNGMDVVRLNTAHQTPETTLKIIKNVRNVSHKISLLLDIKGPEMRTTKVNEPINFKRGDSVSLRGGTKVSTKECVYIAYNAFVRDVPKDSTILIDDGELEMVVKQRTKQDLICEIIHDGYLKSRKTVNVPGIRINLPTLTSKDRTYIKFAVRHKLDFIALSFVRRKQDVITLRNILKKHKSPIQIISKIENHEGVENIDEIISASDGIMIARGDLGVEKPPEEVPLIQKSIINKSILSAKCVITATQMMQSMIDNPRPTRAEVSDVANAILDGTDAVMLSGETAYGKYPIHAVKVMARIAKSVEADKAPFKYYLMKKKPEDVRMRLAKSAVSLVSDDPFNAIVMISRK
ncbi:MAG: pyruvate kinase, partial [Candidatus Woesearchaeota archaeon]|nr:pyruvate kinase [Candidatus Woesearchaeota archaeon]